MPSPDAASAHGEARRWLTPEAVHWATLGMGLMVLLILGGSQWFFGDDFSILVFTDPMRSHVGHWNTVASLIFSGLFRMIGLSSYLPYLIPAFLAHLAVVHLTWRLLLRVGISPWLATLGATTVLLFGAAAENLLWAFQVGFMGSMACALGTLLLLLRERLTVPAAVGAAVLAVAGLPFASTAIPVLAAAGIVGLIRHGWWRTIAVLAPAALVYLAWFLVVRVPSPDILAPHGIEYLTAVPIFFGTVIAAGYGRWVGPVILGVFIAAGLAVWALRGRREWLGRKTPAYALLVGVLVFAALTSVTRGGMVIQAAAAERYAYVVVIMSLPALLLIVDRLWRLNGIVRLTAGLLVSAVTVVNLNLLVVRGLDQATLENRVRVDLAAASDLIVGDATLDDRQIPVLEGAPDVTVGVLRSWIDQNLIPPAVYTSENVERVEYFLEITAPTD